MNQGAMLVKSLNPETWLIAGNFAIDNASAVGAKGTNTCGAYSMSFSKPAGTGIYRVTLVNFPVDILYAEASLLKAAGTLDAQVRWVTSTPSTGVVEFQVQKTSDGTALDPTSLTLAFFIIVSNTSVTV